MTEINKLLLWQILFDSLKLFSEDFRETRQQPVLDIREELE